MVNLLYVGILLVFIGVSLVFISAIASEKSSIKSAGGIFIGPIPVFGYFSDKRLLYLLFGIAIAIFILGLVLRRFI